MAHPEMHNQDRSRHPRRDPRAIGTRPSFDWVVALALIAGLVFALLVIRAISTDESATNAPADQSTTEAPAVPATAPPPTR
jgi:hypothetical protein